MLLLFWHSLDIAWSLCVIFPLTALYWSGTWKLLDLYVVPDDYDLSAVVCVLIGTFIGLFSFAIFPWLKHHIRISCSIKHIIISRTCIYINAAGILMYWRGVWNLSLQYFFNSLASSVLVVMACIVFLVLFKCCGQAVGNPFCISLDTGPDIYDSATRFKSQPREGAYAADVVFSFVVLNFVMCVYWSAVWNFLDKSVHPDNLLISYVISLALGCTVLILFLVSEAYLIRVTKHLLDRGFLIGLMFEDGVKIVASIVTVLIWRGGWGLLKDYLLTDSQQVAWVCHIVGIGVLMLLQCSSTLSTLSVTVDGELGEGKDITFSINYFTHLWKLYHYRTAPLLLQVGEKYDDSETSLLQHDVRFKAHIP